MSQHCSHDDKVFFAAKLGLSAICLLMCLLIWTHSVFAEVRVYPFDSELEEKRFHALLGELRCPKCQNQSLADSDAPIAEDLREKVYALLQDGKSDQEIRNYLIERYGEFVSYRPPLRASTYLLWLGPAIVLGLSLLIAVWQLRKNVHANDHNQG